MASARRNQQAITAAKGWIKDLRVTTRCCRRVRSVIPDVQAKAYRNAVLLLLMPLAHKLKF